MTDTNLPGRDTPARILVVDDEPPIRDAIVRALNLMGYRAQEAGSGREALKLLEAAPHDLMVLDMRMPEMDGLEVMRRARQMCPDLLIIILTGYATLESALAAIKSDATDYLLKPTSVHDIAATITTALQARAEQLRKQHLLRVVSQAMDALRQVEATAPSQLPAGIPPERFLRAGPLTFDRRKRLAVVAGDPPRTSELTEGEALILVALMEQLDQTLACRQLARAAWDYDLDEREAQSLVRPYIFRLRHKLEATPDAPQMIRTVRGRGYVFTS